MGGYKNSVECYGCEKCMHVPEDDEMDDDIIMTTIQRLFDKWNKKIGDSTENDRREGWIDVRNDIKSLLPD